MKTLPWSEVQALLVLSQSGSIAAASRDLGLSEATVRSRVDRLERVSRAPLIVRRPAGIEMTNLGMDAAQKLTGVASSIDAFERKLREVARDNDRSVRIVATEGLGTYWLASRLTVDESEPDIRSFTIDCNMDLPDFERGQVDIAVHLDDIASNHVASEVIGRLTIHAYASKSYLQKFGDPTSANLQHHRIVLQRSPQLEADPSTGPFSAELLKHSTVLRVNASSAHFEAVRSGVGIGALPSYAELVDDRLVRTSLPLTVVRPIKMSVARDRRRHASVSKAMTLIRNLFSEPSFS